MINKIDNVIVLKRQYKVCVFIAFNKIKKEEFCTSFITLYVTLLIYIYISNKQMEILLISKFFSCKFTKIQINHTL